MFAAILRLLLASSCASLTGLHAQDQRQDPPAGQARGDWRVEAVRLQDDDRIQLDGRFDEDAWARAPFVTGFMQVEPVQGVTPPKDTRVRVLYNSDTLYLSLECDDDPDKVRARLMDRDARLDPDDRVEWWIDTFDDQRFAYWFQIGAGGSLGDALIGQGFNKSWDTIWDGRVQKTRRGWQAEIGIPFKSIRFGPSGVFGFNVRRLRKENEEEYRWAFPKQGYQFFDIVNGGKITGLSGMRQGIGLDVIPYTTANSGRDRTATDDDLSTVGDWGFDVNYRLTSSLNMRLTYNTDFSETEVDTRQSNLTRFPLFFPERRDFFLEDDSLFRFASSGNQEVIPYFSRRIGRDDSGGTVPILFGAKLAGSVSDWNLGVLQVYQDDHFNALNSKFSDSRTLGVTRVSRNIGRESSAGILVTNGAPTDAGEALTVGADFLISDSRAFGEGAGYDLSGYFLNSQRSGDGGDGSAYGLQFDYADRRWDAQLQTTNVERDFRPELGFVRRTNIRTHRGRIRHTWRRGNDDFVRRISSRFAQSYTTDIDNRKDTWDMRFRPGEIAFRSEDKIFYDLRRDYFRLDDNFEIRDGVIIPPGDYTFTSHEFGFETFEGRPLNASASIVLGDFFTGTRTSLTTDVVTLFGPHVQIAAGYRKDGVNLGSAGAFTTEIYSGRVDLALSPFVTWKNLVQYDSDSRNLSAQSRVRWIFEPGRELFLVGLFGWDRAVDTNSLTPTSQEVALKVVYTIRF